MEEKIVLEPKDIRVINYEGISYSEIARFSDVPKSIVHRFAHGYDIYASHYVNLYKYYRSHRGLDRNADE
jgi:hypothetical protein